jgi:hypothetical protein
LTFRFTQKAAVIFKINVSGISTQQIVYWVNLEYSVNRACYPCHMHYDCKIECRDAENVYTHAWMAYLLFRNFQVCQCHLVVLVACCEEAAFWAEVPPGAVEERRFLWAPTVSVDFVLCHFGITGRRPFEFVWTIARRLSIAAFTMLCPAHSSPHFFTSQTSAQGFLIRCCVYSIGPCENPRLAILAVFQPTPMADCSRCTRPPCLAIVTDMLKTYKKLVAASKRKIWLLPQPYTTQ